MASLLALESKIISVVVVAHGREKFLPEAINSIMNQSCDAQGIEIVIVSDFYPGFIDKLQTEIPIIHVVTDKITLMEKILLGMHRSNGKYVAFLEDDDTFKPDKIKKLLSTLEEDGDIVYVHNSQKVMDSSSRILNHNFRTNTEERINFQPDLTSKREMKNILGKSPDFNLSSICVRRDIFLKTLDRMPVIVDAVDTLFFHIALSSNKKIVLLPDPLTNYRFHESQSNNLGSFSNFTGNRYDYTERYVNSLQAILKNLDGGLSKNILNGIISDTFLNLSLLSKTSDRKKMLSFIKGFIRNSKYFSARYFLLKSCLSVIYLFSPNLAKMTYYWNRSKERERLIGS